ncbi:MAG: lytic murein transglycosylase [Nocardioides sp.]
MVTAALPLALLPALLITAPSSLQAAGSGRLPDGSAVPAQSLSFPASVTVPSSAAIDPDANSTSGGLPPGIVVTADGGASDPEITPAGLRASYDIPSTALAAYQRAQTVINAADPACRLPWQLLAAIGRVESNHGQFGGSELGADGVARPPIIGVALNGSGTQRITDTDDGRLDGDTLLDRAVGPMQFIPSTWSAVGVDADGDQQRNPQDIDDAALAAAVYLCSGSGDLSTTSGQHDAVFRYNHSEDYVRLVLDIMGDYGSAVPTSYPGYPTSTPSTPTPSTPTPQPGQPTATAVPNPGSTPTPGSGGPNDPALPTVTSPPPGTVLTAAEAAAQCLAEGKVNNPLRSDDAFDRCVADYTS